MGRDANKACDYIKKLSKKDAIKMLTVLVPRMIEIEELCFREADPDPDEGGPAEIYWESCGDNILED